MPARLEIRLSLQKLLLALVIVIVPLSIVGLVLTTRSDQQLDRSIGTNFKTMAQIYANETANFIRERVSDLNTIAGEPALVDTVTTATRSSNNGGKPNTAESPSAAKTVSMTPNGTVAKGTHSATVSELLGRRRELDPRFLRLTATDMQGNVIATTQKNAMSSLAQDESWQAVYQKASQGAVVVSNILFDEFNKAYYVNVDVPILDMNSSQGVGVLAAAVNISTLLSRFQQDQIGNGARAVLVKDDGTIVSAPNADVFANMKSQEFGAIRDSLGNLKGMQTGWVTADLANGPYLVGFAETGLKQHYDNLGWTVLVSQEEHQAAAPIRQLEAFALVMVILGLLMVTLVAAFYYVHRRDEVEEIEELIQSKDDRAAAASSGL